MAFIDQIETEKKRHAELDAATVGLAALFGDFMHTSKVALSAAEPPPRLRFEVCTGRRMFVMWATDRKEAYKDACALKGLAPGSPFPGSIKQRERGKAAIYNITAKA